MTNLQAGWPEKLGYDYWLSRDLSFPAACRQPRARPGSLSSRYPTFFPRGQIGRGVKLTIYFELGPKYNEEWSYTSFLPYVVAWCCTWQLSLRAAFFGVFLITKSKSNEARLGVFERKVLRAIFGPTNDNGEWRRKYNDELYTVYKDSDIITYIKKT